MVKDENEKTWYIGGLDGSSHGVIGKWLLVAKNRLGGK